MHGKFMKIWDKWQEAEIQWRIAWAISIAAEISSPGHSCSILCSHPSQAELNEVPSISQKVSLFRLHVVPSLRLHSSDFAIFTLRMIFHGPKQVGKAASVLRLVTSQWSMLDSEVDGLGVAPNSCRASRAGAFCQLWLQVRSTHPTATDITNATAYGMPSLGIQPL